MANDPRLLSDWNLPPASSEARALLPIARECGVEAARRLILVTEKEKDELARWAWDDPLLTWRIRWTLRWREEVLREFDALIAAQQESKLGASQNPRQELSQESAPALATMEKRDKRKISFQRNFGKGWKRWRRRMEFSRLVRP